MRSVDLRERILGEGMILAFIALVVYFALANPRFLSEANLINVFRQTAEIGIGAAGQALVILIAGIDLSVGSVLALSGLAAATFAIEYGLPPPIAIGGALLLAAGAGAINGLAVTRLGVAAIIVTLASMTYIRGFVFTWSSGVPIFSGLPDVYRFIGAGYIGGIVPVPVVLLIAVYLVGWLLLNKTVFGTHVYAVGGNPEAARLAGVPIHRVRVVVFTLSATLAGLAGIMVMGRVASAQPVAGIGFELDTITAVALGGVSLFGGRGSLVRVFLASLLLAVLGNGFVLIGLSPFIQEIIKGFILLGAVALDLALNRRRRFAS